jgi:hypothetical protein
VGNKTFEDICARIPVHKRPASSSSREKRQVVPERAKWRPQFNNNNNNNPPKITRITKIPAIINGQQQQQQHHTARQAISSQPFTPSSSQTHRRIRPNPDASFVRSKLSQLGLQNIPAPDLVASLRDQSSPNTNNNNATITFITLNNVTKSHSESVSNGGIFIRPTTTTTTTTTTSSIVPLLLDETTTTQLSQQQQQRVVLNNYRKEAEAVGISLLKPLPGFDPSIVLPRDEYCPLAESVDMKCWTPSPLVLWNFDKDTIASLSQEDIINAFNDVTSSPVYGTKADYISYLGRTERDANNRVIGAQAIRTLWIVRVNLSAITEEDRAIIAAASFVVSK